MLDWYYLLLPRSRAMAATHPVAVKLDPSVLGRIKDLAKARDRTPHWMMREAVEQYVDREEKREALRQDALGAWSEYQATGQHVTHAEADAWLAKLEAGQDVEPPECHS
jgi:predicted transcriptional regulator